MAATGADLAACRALLRGGSRTFYAASFLLPRAVRDPASALYGFCRVADDAVDSGDPGFGLERVRERLERIYAGRPLDFPADRAFARVVRSYAIPRALPEALLEGFAWDAIGRRYETLDDLIAYAARVAGAVGAMMSLIMGARSPEALARACELGVAMQLSNVARDVGEDARNGRLYLPIRWLREAGIDPDAFLRRPEFSPSLGEVVVRLVKAAERIYSRARPGIERLPPACRPGIRAAALLYAEIGHEVRRAGGDSVSQRARVPAARKAWLVAQAFVPGVGRGDRAPLAQTRFLVQAAAAAPGPAIPPPEPLFPWDLRGRLVRVIELFERLERRERALRAGG